MTKKNVTRISGLIPPSEFVEEYKDMFAKDSCVIMIGRDNNDKTIFASNSSDVKELTYLLKVADYLNTANHIGYYHEKST